ncbi:MAG: lysostaphin resistance A-like protein [Cyanobium sp.]
MSPPPSGPSPASGPAPEPGWKVLLALLSLALTALLWFEGLAGSVEQPSVSNDLTLHQLELAALVEGRLSEPLAGLLLGDDPRRKLATALETRISSASPPAPISQRLELALLNRGSSENQADPALSTLVQMVEAARRPLLEALVDGQRRPPEQQQALLLPWKPGLLLAQLSCEQLGGPEQSCPANRLAPWLLLRLLGVELLPALLLLLGIALLIRELWLLWKGRLAAHPPLVGPPLSLVDTTLLIAGGFVLVGEVLLPELLQRPLQLVLQRLSPNAAIAHGLQVVVLYAGLSLVPLLVLVRLLPRQQSPAEGWLQWRWRPFLQTLRQALTMLLLVLPPVALCGWLIDAVWRDPGGSNPMLDLVLTGSDPIALACFALTAIVLAPLFEETLFRGVLLPVLGRRLGVFTAVLLSAALFAAAHLSLSEFLPLFVLGCGLGWLRLRSGRLGASVLMHALWNGLTFANLLLLAG